VARPLLGVTKVSIFEYLRLHELAYRMDSTNESDEYLRNKVRHAALPTLHAIFPSLRASLSTVAEKASLDEVALQGYAELMLARNAEHGLFVKTDAFDAAPLAVRTRALYRLCDALGQDRVPWRLVSAAAASDRASGRLASGAGVDFIREDGRVCAMPAGGSHGSRSIREDAATQGAGACGFSVLAESSGDYRIGKAGICRIYLSAQPGGLRADSFSWPLWIRSRRSGDAIRTKGGLKMVDALASEFGVAVSRRDELPIVEDSDGIVAVLAAALGGKDVYRRNDSLACVPATGFLVFDLKGVAFNDAVQR